MGESGKELEQGQARLDWETLTSRVAELERRVGPASSLPPEMGFSDHKLAVLALSIYRARQRRLRHFDADLFAEPAWDMLLDLFVHRVHDERVSTTSLCLAARVPQATGLRWIEVLIDKGLARRLSAPDDGRLSLIELTKNGYRHVRAYIVEGISKFDMPAPDPIIR